MDLPNDQKLMLRNFNRPLLVHPSYLPVLAANAARRASGITVEMIDQSLAKMEQRPPAVQNGVSVIPVQGYLTQVYDFIGEVYFGETSYERLSSQFQIALADPTVKAIVFDVRSPGGESAGLFDFVDEIYAARGQKPIYAVFNEDGFSAAFAIASAADKRYIPRTGAAGSVGVVALHIDQSGWDANIGLVYTYVYAGARKIDYSSHAALSPDALASAQEDVNATYDLFVNTVARNLGISPAAVRATEAAIYTGKKAVDIGFADSVKSWNQFMGQLTSRKYGGIMKAELENLWKEMSAKFMALIGATPDSPEIKDAVTKADAEKLITAAETTAKAEGRTEGMAAGKAEALARAKDIAAVCQLAGMDKMTLEFISGDLSSDKVRERIQEIHAAVADAAKISSTVSSVTTGKETEGDNPLIKGAKKAAEQAKANATA